MELVFLFVGSVGLMWLAARAGFRVSDQTIAVLTRGIYGWRAADWPRGVQEEDRDRPWGTKDASPTNQPPPIVVPISRVRPSVRVR